MSNRYKGGVISATPPTTTGGESGTASGAWTLEQQMQLQAAGLWPAQPTGPYIEQVFSTYLYTGNGSSQTITNGIDLSTNGGLVWIKRRNGANSNSLVDSATSSNGRYYLISDLTDGLQDTGGSTFPFTSSGFSLNSGPNQWNGSAGTYASWTFRKQPKFFDIATFTSNASGGGTFTHNLGSEPGFIIVKSSSNADQWTIYHRSLGRSGYMYLNTTAANNPITNFWTVSSTSVTYANDYGPANASMVAYLFAHNAGGFGLSGSDNVISCGSFVTDGSGKITAPVNLGYEVQWLLVKNSGSSENWQIYDTMRGMSNTGYSVLYPNLTSAEYSGTSAIAPNATGFSTPNASGPFASFANYIYIAIRRGPMRVPTLGTSVFSPVARTGTGTITTVTAGFAPDFAISAKRTSGEYMPLVDKLRGPTYALFWQQGKTDAENSSYATDWFTAFTNTGVIVGPDNGGGQAVNASGSSFIQYYFQRAPSFMDTVCYTGDSTTPRTITHNLGVAPELIFIKNRNNTRGWATYVSGIGAGKYLLMNTTNAALTDTTIWANTAPTSSVFTVGDPFDVNNTGYTYVAHLFATCPGVSKVGSYTGNATLTTINCGFTGGARYVLIKRTDVVGNWVMWDTARGMVSGTDPSVSSNYQGAEINGDSVYTTATGFQLLASPYADINTNGGTYIFLAIA